MREHELSITKQVKALRIIRSSVYYLPPAWRAFAVSRAPRSPPSLTPRHVRQLVGHTVGGN
jgi:hypothetical protein